MTAEMLSLMLEYLFIERVLHPQIILLSTIYIAFVEFLITNQANTVGPRHDYATVADKNWSACVCV